MSTVSTHLDPEVLDALRVSGRARIRDLAAQVDRSQEFSRELWDLLCELGLPTMPFADPEAGHEGSFLAYVEAIEEVASHGAVAALYSGPTVQVASAIRNFGSPEQQERWGEGLISGGLLGAWSFTEPQTGSDPQQILTRAVREGTGWRITGSKMFTSFAPHADVALVYAKTTDRRLGAFLVDTTDPGWQPGPPIKMLSFGGQGTAPVSIDVHVEDSALLGGPESGFDIMISTEAEAKIRASSICIGIGRRAVEEAVAYASGREHRGEPIGDKFPTIQATLGEMAAQVAGARTMVQWAARAVDARDPDLKMIAASTRIVCARMAREVSSLAMQVCGAYGFTHEMVLERLYREGKFYEVGQGVIELQKLIVGKHLLREHAGAQPKN
ncbi:hypothetical protein ASD65_10035 [Microbacterium sp. Root61]|uniref:acyl-CoA dehydrogenase family protein n=1 Tax=Microbacterium sp. Root61 TaxID=1736570 RepID=UPI00070165FE|nr:acyl-CoA dehydrogenase family protein [Microbacterium sp. Root61]KRA24719.1 hypothetical protein ASD65_10035 [Microbacterium sp. Root61]